MTRCTMICIFAVLATSAYGKRMNAKDIIQHDHVTNLDSEGLSTACPQKKYGVDTEGKCRSDHKGNNGVLDRIADMGCCKRYEAKHREFCADHIQDKEVWVSLAPGKLSIKNIEGHDLPNKDGWGAGKTDAYVKVVVTDSDGGSQEKTTVHIDNSLNPKWDFTHTFDIEASDIDSTDKFTLEVVDKDNWLNFAWDGDDEIGDVEILYRQTPPNEWVRFAHPTVDSKGKEQGTLQFDLKWEPEQPTEQEAIEEADIDDVVLPGIDDIEKREKDTDPEAEPETIVVGPDGNEETVVIDMTGAPDCKGLAATAAAVIDAKIAAAEAALKDAQALLMVLSTSTKASNATKMHEAVNAMMAANVAKAAAVAVKVKVTVMIEACNTLTTAVKSFKANTEPRATLQHKDAEASMNTKIDDLRKATVAAERIDLANLLKLIDEVRAAQKAVKTLDAKVNAGAAVSIDAASALVYKYADQLIARHGSLTSADAFKDMVALKPENAKLEVDKRTTLSIAVVSDKLAAIIAEKAQIYTDAQAALMKLSTSTQASNATKMHEAVDAMMAANLAKADAEALVAAVDRSVRAINAFFKSLKAYRAKQAEKKAIATATVTQIKADADKLKDEADASVLEEVGGFFRLYHLMWVGATEVHAATPEGDADFAGVDTGVQDSSKGMHVWVNDETQSVCTYYTGCTKARAELLKPLEANNNYCDERAELGKTVCTTKSGGHAANGKMCYWIEADNAKATRGNCKSVRPDTNGLKWGQDYKPEAGIFY